jgi:Ras-related protein Rab-1A
VSEDSLYVFKVIVAGPSQVGKTCLVQRFVDGVFLPDTKSTIGVDFSLKNVSLEDPDLGLTERVALQIWDMAGEERFRSILPYYIAGTQGIILVFDITNPESLGSLGEWIEVIKTYLPGNIPMVLLSAKNDLEPKVTDENVQEFLTNSSVPLYFKTSSYNGDNVNEAFTQLTKMIAKGRITN